MNEHLKEELKKPTHAPVVDEDFTLFESFSHIAHEGSGSYEGLWVYGGTEVVGGHKLRVLIGDGIKSLRQSVVRIYVPDEGEWKTLVDHSKYTATKGTAPEPWYYKILVALLSETQFILQGAAGA